MNGEMGEDGQERRGGKKMEQERKGLWKEKTGWRRFSNEVVVRIFLFPLWCVWIVWRIWQWGKGWTARVIGR
jgi:hypothetical protein